MSETPPTQPSGAASPFYRAPPPRRRPAWRTAIWIGAAILAAIVVAWLLTPHGQPAHAPGGRGGGAGGAGGGRVPTVVGVATAVKGDIPITLTELGTVTPEATVTVQTQIAGTLEKVDFKEGQTVRKGQLLAEIDTRPYVVALAQAEGQLARDQASLGNAQLDLKRYQTLASQDSISGQQVDTQAALVKQDEGTVKTDEANIAAARLNLTYCHIVAPVSGRVGLRQVDPGNYVTSGSANGVVIITQFDPIDVVFSMPEDNVPQVSQRMSSGATLTATALDRTGATTLGQGTLLTLDNQIDTATGTIKAKARFSNPNGTLFPNQFVNVTLLVDTLKDVVVVPTAAVRHGANGDFIFVVDQDPIMGGNIARMANVKVGPSQGDNSSIASGINPGDQVITDGGDRLTDGGTIILPGQIPPGFGSKPAKKPTGFFGWLGGLFGHKPAAGDSSAAAASGGGFGGSTAGGRGAGGGRGGGAARMQAMFGQLDLTPDQKTKLAAIQAEMSAKMQAAAGDPDARRAAMKDSMAKINAILTPAQQAKMAQLRSAARAAYGGGNGSGAPAAPAAGGDQSAQSASPPSATPGPGTAATPSGPGGATGGAPPGGGGRGGGERGLLMQVLDDDQKAKLKAMVDEARASGDPAAFQAIRGKVAAMLRPDQKAKLDQLRAAQAASGGGGQ